MVTLFENGQPSSALKGRVVDAAAGFFLWTRNPMIFNPFTAFVMLGIVDIPETGFLAASLDDLRERVGHGDVRSRKFRPVITVVNEVEYLRRMVANSLFTCQPLCFLPAFTVDHVVLRDDVGHTVNGVKAINRPIKGGVRGEVSTIGVVRVPRVVGRISPINLW